MAPSSQSLLFSMRKAERWWEKERTEDDRTAGAAVVLASGCAKRGTDSGPFMLTTMSTTVG
jgi:hypothetical protein